MEEGSKTELLSLDGSNSSPKVTRPQLTQRNFLGNASKLLGSKLQKR